VNLGSNARINKVIGRLLVSMYNSVNFGVVWKLGTVLFLNNTRVFHGRTQDRGSPSVLGRHLKRIRLV
jgi:alpha-ketoglutarate-dependent taurine dioxygenase